MKAIAILGASIATVAAQTQRLTVGADGGNRTSRLLYGALYEEIYHSGDGGFYAEMIRNRAFQGSITGGAFPGNSYDPTTDFWTAVGAVSLSVDSSDPVLSGSLPNHMSIQFDNELDASQPVGVANAGFYGMRVDVDREYVASFYVRGDYSGGVTGSFVNTITGDNLATTRANVDSQAGNWTQVWFPAFRADSAPGNPNNTFHFTFDNLEPLRGASLQVNLLSVFQQTYNNNYNGLRIDMVEAFAELGTTWTRLPGGNSMQGPGRNEEFKYNETIGDLRDRPGMLGVWGYPITNGFGILEQMQWMRDTNQDIFLGLFAGLHIGGDLVPESELQPYIDMALDELEFLTGDASTRLGAVRASLGFPEAFPIRHVEIGNEDYLNGGTDSYYAYRFPKFYEAIRERYPEMNIISSIVPSPVQTPGTWLDIHIYQGQDAFAREYGAFDNTDRDYPVIVGEYACIFAGSNGFPEIGAQTFGMALAESIMLLGAERNSDVIKGTAHGALDKHYDEEPDTVAVFKHTADRILRTNSFYLQKTMARYFGDATLPVETQFGEGIDPLFWSATKSDAGSTFMKVLNYYGPDSVVEVAFEGDHQSVAEVIVFTAPGCDSTNGFPELGGMTSEVRSESLTESEGVFRVVFQRACEMRILVV